jgi:glycosyltransferase involved in cell wall biosynthesis
MYHGNLAAQAASVLLPGKTPVIWNIRGTHHILSDEKLLTAAAIWIGARLSALPLRIVNNSNASAELHRRSLRFSQDRWVIIPNGFELDHFEPSTSARAEVRAELAIPPEALLIGLIGRYHPVKDHANFLRAAAILRKTVPGAHFLMAGSGVDQAAGLRACAFELGLLDFVRLLGERSDMPRITAALDIATSSSYSEGFPNVIGEAMCCAVPCAVTDVGDSAWLVGDTGAVAPASDAEALAAAWLKLSDLGPEGRRRLGVAARERIVTRFSIDSVAAQYEQMYEQLLERNTQRRGARPCAA